MDSNTMRCLYDLAVPMRDGVVLRGDLYRPSEEGRYPVLLIRTVFRKDWMGRCFAQYDPAFFVRHGYAVMIQDVRGLGRSDGEFRRFHADGADGFDTVEWLAAQPFCTGDVGMMGSYYAGFLQLMTAAENPPHLRAICPAQTSVSLSRDCDNRGFTFASHIGWCMSRQINRLRDGRYDAETTSRWLAQLERWIADYPASQLTSLPLLDMPAANETPFPLLADYRTHLLMGYDDPAMIHEEGRDMDVGRIRIPAFYYCGWYDSSRTPLIRHCQAQRRVGVDSRVLVAPWAVDEQPAMPDGPLETGAHTVDIQQDMLQWFDCWLKGVGSVSFAPYRVADMQRGTLVCGEAWPPAVVPHRLYLGTGHRLLPVKDSQTLSCDSYRHDPAHPLPYHPFGKAECLSADAKDARLLRYMSLPAEAPLTLRGMVSCHLFLSSDAADADVMVSLSDIAPDGQRFILCDGATRMSYRSGGGPTAVKPGQVYGINVLMGEMCDTLPAGHRLLLEIAGSAFPKYDVNAGTAQRAVTACKRVSSRQRVWHGAVFASYLQLTTDPGGE